MYGNRKWFQWETKILELDWSENYRIQENTRFFVKYRKNIKLLQWETKILECDWSKKKNISENADFCVKLGINM
jgi:hypothetical protein